MIELTRLNKTPLLVNSDLIKFVERVHDTVITLQTGEKIMVLEPAGEVLERMVEYRQRILAGLDPSVLLAALTAGEVLREGMGTAGEPPEQPEAESGGPETP